MNTISESKPRSGIIGYLIAVTGAFLIVAVLVLITYQYTHPTALGEDRAAARSKALKELRASNTEVLDNPNYVWQDAAKGLVRLPITNAMALALKLWENPAAGRSNLVARVEKATAPQQLE